MSGASPVQGGIDVGCGVLRHSVAFHVKPKIAVSNKIKLTNKTRPGMNWSHCQQKAVQWTVDTRFAASEVVSFAQEIEIRWG